MDRQKRNSAFVAPVVPCHFSQGASSPHPPLSLPVSRVTSGFSKRRDGTGRECGIEKKRGPIWRARARDRSFSTLLLLPFAADLVTLV